MQGQSLQIGLFKHLNTVVLAWIFCNYLKQHFINYWRDKKVLRYSINLVTLSKSFSGFISFFNSSFFDCFFSQFIICPFSISLSFYLSLNLSIYLSLHLSLSLSLSLSWGSEFNQNRRSVSISWTFFMTLPLITKLEKLKKRKIVVGRL